MSDKPYTIKTKQVQAKVYCIVFVNKALQKQVMKQILAFTFEDAIGIARIWMTKNLGISSEEAYGYEPTMYEAVNAESLVDLLVEGEEQVLTDVNSIMNSIVSATTKKEAEALLKQHKGSLTQAGVKFCEDAIKKMNV